MRCDSPLLLLRRFRADRSGATVVLFTLGLIPVLAAVGAAVDYSRASSLQTFVQTATDAAALAAAAETDPAKVPRIIEGARERVLTAQRQGIEGGVVLDAGWINETDFRVAASVRLTSAVVSAVPGMPKSMEVSAVSVARLKKAVYVSDAPKVAQLDPEAFDYNQIAVYCFNAERKADADRGRTQMTVIADNAGTKYEITMPRCALGETFSYRLLNVRNARSDRARWNDGAADRHEYHTDTTVVAGVPKSNFFPAVQILETVICDTFEECKGKSQGGVLPEGKNRTPQAADKACVPGKFLYMGWEDRPPGSGWSDRDYDDIRVVVGCPRVEKVSDQSVWLVK